MGNLTSMEFKMKKKALFFVVPVLMLVSYSAYSEETPAVSATPTPEASMAMTPAPAMDVKPVVAEPIKPTDTAMPAAAPVVSQTAVTPVEASVATTAVQPMETKADTAAVVGQKPAETEPAENLELFQVRSVPWMPRPK